MTRKYTGAEEVAVGDVVEVGPAYQGGGFYASDGNEGVYTVVGLIPPFDYKLVRGVRPDAESHEWEVICHVSRIQRGEA